MLLTIRSIHALIKKFLLFSLNALVLLLVDISKINKYMYQAKCTKNRYIKESRIFRSPVLCNGLVQECIHNLKRKNPGINLMTALIGWFSAYYSIILCDSLNIIIEFENYF